jgi:uncharacterized surface protein with fasciclin (FAS1) repeats
MRIGKALGLVSLALMLAFAVGAVAPPRASAAPAGASIVDIALAVNAETGEFSTLIAALQAADLVGALDGNRHYTVFAPTDAAFAQLELSADNIGSLDKATLTNILLYHVTRGDRFSQSVVGAKQLRMLNGGFTTISTSGGVTINGANIVAVDIDASNGVIHVIDQVLLP